MKKMRSYFYGELKYLVLKKVSEAPLTLDDMVDWLITPGSGSKGGWTKKDYWEFTQRKNKRSLVEKRKKEERKIYVLLNRLQASGLVAKQKTKGGKNKWLITKQGITDKGFTANLVKGFINRKKHCPTTSYSKINLSKQRVIIIFDIKEKERWKREWLRTVLKNLNFEMIQKSVWLGNTALPQEFLEDLKKLNLLNSVRVFSIADEGSIKF